MTEASLTTSWDDGHPLDLILAEMLIRHGIAGTFYVPIANSEGRPTLDAAQVRQLAAAGFEIGSHTHDHLRLDRLDLAEMLDQVTRGKEELEQRLGQPVSGFCPPGGRGMARLRPHAARLGLTHARTVEMFRLDEGHDSFARPTTLQVYPHGAAALMSNWGRRGLGGQRLGLCLGCLARPGLEARLDWLLDEALRTGGTLHLWGHSWEMEQGGLWPVLDRFLARAARAIPATRRVDNATAFAKGGPCAS
ncbi:polysaccharide deacetylase family protein [Paramagnetospirillum magneticum]|uniref:Chitooligosaccharide deacetylase n=1 Tax=Paramagnetospirillum magneticum (strain ATCC 700264 / AMB-1) TaxID=342108 RepID=Q2W7D0_PARM1|nr:polysaccharide deacetylase family protein [Paramagnetospirillum magneticum]BAE50245.1 Predicted xylanase/chitin deacetylase [Paramagnetospirillum magneticum AMB-1]